MPKRWLLGVALWALLSSRGSDSRASSAPTAAGEGDPRSVGAHLALLPLRFEPNRGQLDPRASFVARAPGYDLFLADDGVTLAFRRKTDGEEASAEVLRMRVVGGRSVRPVGSDRLPGSTNYFIGQDPSKWRAGVEGYARVQYRGVLPGVDVVYYGTGARHLEYDVTLAPGADPSGVVLRFGEAQRLEIDEKGAATFRLPGGREITQPAPVAYQLDAAGKRESVGVRYVRRDGGLGFSVDKFDASRTLVIDPTLTFSTYIGGLAADGAYGVAFGPNGEAFIAGTTASTNFPVAGAPQGAFGGGHYDVFVTKLNAAGSAIVYSTYLGGSGDDFTNGLAVDSAGEAFVVGATSSTNFPTVAALRGTYAGGAFDAFVTKLNPAGSAIAYSTYVGGSANDQAEAIAVDGAGEAFVTGFTFSTNFPTQSPLQAANLASGGTAFVAKLNAAGSAFVYSTYLGGSVEDNANGIAIDSAGEAFVAGSTSSSNFPTSGAVQGAYRGAGDAFVAKVSSGGSALLYSTFLGGGGADSANGIAVDTAGDALVVGNTASTDFPTAVPLQGVLRGSQDAFVTKLNSAGTALAYSTYLGGSDADYGNGIGVDATGEAFVAGFTFSVDFPTASAFQGANAGKQDAFVTNLNATGTSLLYSTYLGGGDNEQAYRIAVDAIGEALVVGETASTNFPMAQAMQGTEAGGDDAFVTRLSRASSAPAAAPALGHWDRVLAALLLLCGLAMLTQRSRRATPAG